MAARYAAVLAAPHVLPLGISALLHGLATATAPLALVLLVAERGGSYALLAGAAGAALLELAVLLARRRTLRAPAP